MIRKKRRRRLPFRKPELAVRQILAWADEFHGRTGRWPSSDSGRIAGGLGETWLAVDMALRKGNRGLPGGSSLPRLLTARRGVRNARRPPPLTFRQILAWADGHFRRKGEWPTSQSGAVTDAPGEDWGNIDAALHRGGRGLPVNASLRELLAEHRGARNRTRPPPLTPEQVLAWADAHYRRTGRWPTRYSGPVRDAPGETWAAVAQDLRLGLRGLPERITLADLLLRERGARKKNFLSPLTHEQILAWADAFHARCGRWPSRRSGPIPEAPGETWMSIDGALYQGLRGLRGGTTLVRLLARERGARHRLAPPRLRLRQILTWARNYFARTGRWPNAHSGPVAEDPRETWAAINNALRDGRRGLPGGSSLYQVLRRLTRRPREGSSVGGPIG